MRRRLALLALALTLLPAGSALAATEEDMAVSPDGRHLYAAGQGHQAFAIDPLSGALTTIKESQQGSDGGLGGRVAVSPDGRFVYLGEEFVRVSGMRNYNGGSLHVMSRDASTGVLTHETSVYGGGFPGSIHIGRIRDLELSADGRHLYVHAWSPGAIHVLERSAADGTLTPIQAIYEDEGLPVGDVSKIALAPDGRDLLMAGNGIGILRRDPVTGRLGDGRVVAQYTHPYSLGISPDGRRVYAGGGNYDVYERDPDSGDLTKLGQNLVDSSWCSNCESAFIQASPDGAHVFNTHQPSGVLLQSRTTAEGAQYERRYSYEGWHRYDPTAMTWSVDGRTAYVAAEDRGVGAHRWADGALAEPVYAQQYVDGDSEWSFQPSITINDGALYTNDPEVTVSIVPPFGVYSLRLSNSAGEYAGPSMRIGTGKVRTYRWRLDSTVPGRSAKRVHVRFNPTGPIAIELFDDIVLDQLAPEVLAARLDGSRVRVRARDNRSGVKRVQLTTNRKKPGKSRKYKKSLPSPSARKPVFVRVVDGAGNASKWRTARR
jgi:6-phosphogluconolactonase (cycloisomerase 2 family)